MNNDAVYSTVHVDLGERAYDIRIGGGLIANAGAHIKDLLAGPRVFVVTDEHVAEAWLPALEKALAAEGIEVSTKILPPGEQTKSFTYLEELTSWLLDQGIDRKTTIVAFGGGVIGDLVGFAAAITLRGIPFIQIPTTLLAQVDSSVGGKTAIDMPQGKNLAGAFYQPRLVLADTYALDTLPRRQVLAGYAEVVKYGLINDPDFFEWCEANGPALLNGDAAARRQAVEASCRAKAAIVQADEREAGQRALLNLGHTFAHAFEAQLGYADDLLHGEAVALGCLAAFELSRRLELCPGQDTERLRAHLDAMGLRTTLAGITDAGWTPDVIIGHMGKDKKVDAGQINFILARGIGQAFVTNEVPQDILRDLLSDILSP